MQTDIDALQQARTRMLADVASTEVTDHKDIAAADQSSDISDATLERLRHALTQCESALQRLDEERYGDGIDCGEPIPWPRLLAQPAAERCAACQRSFVRGAACTGRA